MSRNDKQREMDVRAAAPRALAIARFVLAYAALFTAAGAAVDLTRAHRAENRLEAAARATAARLTGQAAALPLRSLQVAAEGMMAPELNAFADPEAMVHVSVIGRAVRVSASARLPTVFMGLFQLESLPIDVTTTVAPARAPVLIG
jgi:hypothetical protein